MSWFYLTAGSVGLFTLQNIISRYAAVKTDNPRAYSFCFNVFSFLFSLSIFLINRPPNYRISFPSESSAWLFLGLAVLAFGIQERGRFMAAKMVEASTLSIISNISVLVAFTGAIFLYNEPLTSAKALGSLIILTALFLASIGGKSKNVSLKGILFSTFIFTMLGIGWMLDKKGSGFFDPYLYNIFVWGFPIIIIFFPYIKKADIVSTLKKNYISLAVLSLLNVTGYLLQLNAVIIEEATKIIPIVQTSTVFTVVAGVIFLGEKEKAGVKIFSGILAIIGVYFLLSV